MSLSDELEALAKLRAHGSLTEAEYAAAKARLLGSSPLSAPPYVPGVPPHTATHARAGDAANLDQSYRNAVGLSSIGILLGYGIPWVTGPVLGSANGFDVARFVLRAWSNLGNVGLESTALGWLVLAFGVTIVGALVTIIAGFSGARRLAGYTLAAMWGIWPLAIAIAKQSAAGSTGQESLLTTMISRAMGSELTQAVLATALREVRMGYGLWVALLSAFFGLAAAAFWNRRARLLAASGLPASNNPPVAFHHGTTAALGTRGADNGNAPFGPTPALPIQSTGVPVPPLQPPPSAHPVSETPRWSGGQVQPSPAPATMNSVDQRALPGESRPRRSRAAVVGVSSTLLLMTAGTFVLHSARTSARVPSAAATPVSRVTSEASPGSAQPHSPPTPVIAPSPTAHGTTPPSPDTQCDVPRDNETFEDYQRRCGGSSEPTRGSATSAPQTAPFPEPSGARCRLVEVSSFHLRPTATVGRGGSTAYPAGVSVEVLAATDVRRGRTEEMFRVRVIHDGAIGYMFLTEAERTQCGNWGDGRYTLDRD